VHPVRVSMLLDDQRATAPKPVQGGE
jgi:hypothetical protein